MQVYREIPDKGKELLATGFAQVYGGVVRYINSGSKNGQIIAHLENVNECASESLSEVLRELGNINNRFKDSDKIIKIIQNSSNMTNLLSSATLLMSGLNLCVSVAGFALVLNKLKKMDYKLDSILVGIDELKRNEIDKLNLDIKKDLNGINSTLESFEICPNDILTRAGVDAILSKIANVREYIYYLINAKKNSSIKLDDEIIIRLFSSYIAINKLMMRELYRLGKGVSYSELKELPRVCETMKRDVFRDKIYKEMYMCEDEIYTEIDIKNVIKLFYELCDYNIEFVESQQQILLQEPDDFLKIFNEDINSNVI